MTDESRDILNAALPSRRVRCQLCGNFMPDAPSRTCNHCLAHGFPLRIRREHVVQRTLDEYDALYPLPLDDDGRVIDSNGDYVIAIPSSSTFYATLDPAEAPEPAREPRTGLDALLVLVATISLGVLCWYWPAAHGWFAAHAQRWRAF